MTGRESKVNASTASVEDKTAERNLRVTSPAWLKRKRSTESGDFVHESRAGTGAPNEVGSGNESLAEGAEAALERGQRQRLRSKAWSLKDDGRSADGLAAGAVENRSPGISSTAWPGCRIRTKVGSSTESLAGRRKRTAATEDSSSGQHWMVF